MSRDKQPTSWRCRNPKQQKDKAEIYNSREWRELRIMKLRANPLCEVCEQEGIVTSAHAVHHRHPIEDSTSKAEMRKWAFMWENLVSVCDACHAKIHKEERSHSKEEVKARAEQRHERWKDNIMSRFIINNQETMQENKRLGIFGTLNYDKLKDMTMDERKSAVTNHAKDVLSRKTMDGKGPQIPDDDHDPYDVTAEYTIMDCRYNKQGKILATFKAQRTDEGLTIELVSFESATD